MKSIISKPKSILFGLAVGDSVGVPYEFKTREEMKLNPVVDMIGYGSHYQPKGTFSDDTSMAMCIAESFSNEFNVDSILNNFLKWIDDGYWTANGDVFDVGNQTIESLLFLKNNIPLPNHSKMQNGNGSLMRCAPLVFYTYDKQVDERFRISKEVSELTHNHIYSVVACFYYLELLRFLFYGMGKFDAYYATNLSVREFLKDNSIEVDDVFDKLFSDEINTLSESEIESGGYAIHTLEASIWSLLNTDSYKDSILQAVNLGDDTDTTATVVGGMTGLLYGYDNIPTEWIGSLKRSDDIKKLSDRITKILVNLYL